MSARLDDDRGAALIMMLMAIGLCTSLGVALLLTSSAEATTAAQFRDQRAGFYAAEAVAERALVELAAAPDWTASIAGLERSSLVDGPPTGQRVLGDGRTIDLAQAVNMANCQKSSACTALELSATTAQRPWGANNPRWYPYAYGPLRDMVSADEVDCPWYVLLLVAADPLRTAEAIAVRAEAFGPRNAHAVLELTAALVGADNDYNGGAGLRTFSWREVR